MELARWNMWKNMKKRRERHAKKLWVHVPGSKENRWTHESRNKIFVDQKRAGTKKNECDSNICQKGIWIKNVGMAGVAFWALIAIVDHFYQNKEVQTKKRISEHNMDHAVLQGLNNSPKCGVGGEGESPLRFCHTPPPVSKAEGEFRGKFFCGPAGDFFLVSSNCFGPQGRNCGLIFFPGSFCHPPPNCQKEKTEFCESSRNNTQMEMRRWRPHPIFVV